MGPFDAAWFAFYFPLTSFIVVFGPFLLFKKIVINNTLIGVIVGLSIIPLLVSIIIFFVARFAVTERRFKNFSYNVFLSIIVSSCIVTWVISAKADRFGVSVYFAWYFFVHAIRLFLQSLYTAKSKSGFFVKEHLDDAFLSIGSCIYYFCLCFLPVIEFTVEETKFPLFKSELFSALSFYFPWIPNLSFTIMAIGLYALPALTAIYVFVYSHQSRHKNDEKYKSTLWSLIQSICELLMLVTGQIFLLNPISLAVQVIVWAVSRVISACSSCFRKNEIEQNTILSLTKQLTSV